MDEITRFPAARLFKDGKIITIAQCTNKHRLPLFYALPKEIVSKAKEYLELPFFFLKNKLMAMGENRPQNTFFIDYVGGLKTNDYTDQIAEVRYLNADPAFGSLFVIMNETAGYFYINFTQNFTNDRYYRGFAAILDELGIPCEKLPFASFLNPEVELPPEQR